MGFIEVFVRQCVSPHIRLYEVFGQVLSDSEEEYFSFPITRNTANKRAWEAIGPIGRKLISRLHRIDGIEEVFLTYTTVTVVKARTVSWEYIEANVIHSLEVVLGPLEIIEG